MVRIKQRYILGEIVLDQNDVVDVSVLTSKAIQDAFKDAIKDCYGDLGLATIASNFVSKFNTIHQISFYV
jgi:hypothetical protein